MSQGNNRDGAGIIGRDGEGWHLLWTLEPVSRTAVHQSGVTARVTRSLTNPEKDQISLEHLADLDLSRWDLRKITDEAITLWMEGKFERH
ncbi:hypothetical protein [Nitrosospira multiformis]|uniref:Uncharacterized protein n=1 Tax=Nitrosospira multiformis TaxID=1231 RepID=A0A1I7GVH2_9PROT|nr:hypothetical protein [Nitrosospira multiformis]SFU52457.1 hypothetical protein SAMN05216417_10610 [Nitrosospira multiformis]